jgi:hypothetical protein
MVEAELPTRLRQIAEAVRGFLEPYWADWHRQNGSPSVLTLSQGTCGRSSLFLPDVLRARGLPAEFAIGCPSEGAQGFRMGSVWHGHAWVECIGWIVDVTADQFKEPKVVVTRVEDPRYRAGTDAAEPEFQQLRQQTAQRLFAKWTEQTGESHEA